MGMYMPDGIAAYTVGRATYLLTANESDVRDYDAYSEEARVGDESYQLNPERFPNAAELKNETQLGRLTAGGDKDGNGDFETIYAFGGRSFSIWTPTGEQVFDSGDALEQLTAARYPDHFNAAGDDNSADTFDDNSDNKGPEPETVVVGRVEGRPYAFIALERISGVATYDLSDPRAPVYVDYVNNRNFSAEANTPAAGDLSPKGLAFIPAADSPTGQALLVTANEVSGTVSVFAVRPNN